VKCSTTRKRNNNETQSEHWATDGERRHCSGTSVVRGGPFRAQRGRIRERVCHVGFQRAAGVFRRTAGFVQQDELCDAGVFRRHGHRDRGSDGGPVLIGVHYVQQ
jgi:hypothetical protein